MITVEQQAEMQKFLKRGYAGEVGEILQEKGIFNNAGKNYDIRTISAVFNGSRSNPKIEEAIFELVRRKKAIISERDQLLEIKKA